MNTASKIAEERVVVEVRLTEEKLVVYLDDGRKMAVPITDFPRLDYATDEERRDFRLIGGGTGIHWPRLDEDISLESLLAGRASGESAASLERWQREVDRRRERSTEEPWGEVLPLPVWWESELEGALEHVSIEAGHRLTEKAYSELSFHIKEFGIDLFRLSARIAEQEGSTRITDADIRRAKEKLRAKERLRDVKQFINGKSVIAAIVAIVVFILLLILYLP